MNLGLDDKTVLVTGSTAGIGYAAARLFAREGATVILNGRSAERLAAALTTLQTEVPKARLRGVAADVGTAAGCAALAAAEPAADVLINNVGMYGPKAFEDIGDDEWMSHYEVNVMSGV